MAAFAAKKYSNEGLGRNLHKSSALHFSASGPYLSVALAQGPRQTQYFNIRNRNSVESKIFYWKGVHGNDYFDDTNTMEEHGSNGKYLR